MKRTLILCLFLIIGCSLFSQWQSMSSMTSSLSFPVVVVVKGNIHVIGGGGAGGASDLHMRYIPSLDMWDVMAPVPYKAQQPAGAVVNGKIYFCGGGFPNSGTPLKKNYYYDVDSNKWYPAADMPAAAVIHKAVSFDNKLYVLTGQPNKLLCEYYDPMTNTWTQRNSLPDQNFWYGAIVANSKGIFRFGGGGYTGPQKLAYFYDKASDSWESLPDMPIALHGADAVVYSDSIIYIAGGYNNGDKDRVWKYNTNTKTYSSIGVLPAARSYHAMVNLNNCIYAVGGNNNSVPTVATSLIKYCPVSNEAGIDVISRNIQKPYSLKYETNKVTLVFNEETYHENIQVQVYDLTGKLIEEIQLNARTIEIVTSKYNSTMLLLKVSVGSNVFTEKVATFR